MTDKITDPVKALAAWKKLKDESAALVAQERAMRAALFAHFFPAPTEGTNDAKLPDGRVVKGKYPIDRKVDKVVLEVLRNLRLRELEPGMLADLHINPAQYTGEELVLDVVRLQPDTLVSWSPSLATSAYRALTAEQTLIFDRCLTSKPGSISLEVVEPKEPAAQATPAAGFSK